MEQSIPPVSFTRLARPVAGARILSGKARAAPVAATSFVQETALTHLWTIIAVADVAARLAWYQALLGLPATVPAHDYFAQVVAADGTVLLVLHAWGAHEHPTLTSAAGATPGNGLLLFFRVDGFDQALQRARRLVAALAEEPQTNPNTRTLEFSVRDPDGYYVTISAR